jgi:hypothetical protein
MFFFPRAKLGFLHYMINGTINWKASKNRMPRIIFGRMSDTRVVDQWLPFARLEMSGAQVDTFTVGLSSDLPSSPKMTHLFLHATPTCLLNVINWVMDTTNSFHLPPPALSHFEAIYVATIYNLSCSTILAMKAAVVWDSAKGNVDKFGGFRGTYCLTTSGCKMHTAHSSKRT